MPNIAPLVETNLPLSRPNAGGGLFPAPLPLRVPPHSVWGSALTPRAAQRANSATAQGTALGTHPKNTKALKGRLNAHAPQIFRAGLPPLPKGARHVATSKRCPASRHWWKPISHSAAPTRAADSPPLQHPSGMLECCQWWLGTTGEIPSLPSTPAGCTTHRPTPSTITQPPALPPNAASSRLHDQISAPTQSTSCAELK